ncbi:MAG: hemolysin III family protein [Bernardetiaceae bacterium]|jgi:hemolysin III|nr:hemolysin III family protein [Bernardetiaceae bacterium]
MERGPHYFKQELANALTHGLGAVLSAVGLAFLIVKAQQLGGPEVLTSFVVYGAAITFLFTASTLYHSIHGPGAKRALQVVDHIGIYLMIAGTYTPFAVVSLRHSHWGLFLLLVVWGIAGAGIVFKLFFTGRFNLLSTAIYLGMGWLAVVALKPMLAAIPGPGMALIATGGLCFTVGVVFYLWKKLVYHHAIWHLFVLAGGACHYFAVFFYSAG